MQMSLTYIEAQGNCKASSPWSICHRQAGNSSSVIYGYVQSAFPLIFTLVIVQTPFTTAYHSCNGCHLWGYLFLNIKAGL